MRENAKEMDALTREKAENAKAMNAVEHMKFYSQIAETRLNEMKKLIPPFEALHKRTERHDNGRYEHRGRGHERDHYVRGRHEYRPYGYSEPVYVPPPVYYEPPPAPGISIFLPPIHIR